MARSMRALRLSADEAIRRVISLLEAMPEATGGLPEGWRKPGFWREMLGRNERTRRLLEVLRELPALAGQAPRRGTRREWVELMERDFQGPAGVPGAPVTPARQIVGQILKAAAKRPPRLTGKRWRDRFGPAEVVQRVRPKESQAYLHNPHRGTATFQRFEGDPVYATWVTSDTHGPMEGSQWSEVRGQDRKGRDKTLTPTLSLRRERGSERENIGYAPRTTLSYCRWPWAWIEPRKGRYEWKIIDGALRAARERRQTLQVRIQPYTQRVEYAKTPPAERRHPPERSVNVPGWYWDTGAKWLAQGKYAPHEPDCNDPKWVRHFGDFVRALGKRYDGHPDLESVDVVYGGFWGEGGGNATPATAAKLTDVYLRSFRKTQLVSMLDTAGCSHAARAAAKAGRGIGWRADCFGDLKQVWGAGVPPELCWTHTYDMYPKAIAQCGVTEAWRTGPVTMETCWNVAMWYADGYDLDTIIREGYRYHMSVFMPKSAFFPEAWREKLAEFDRKIGYRFVLRQMLLPLEVKRGQRIGLEFFLDNVGCAPIYRRYALAVRFRQGRRTRMVRLKTDIRKWIPGHMWFAEKIAVPPGLKRGEAKVDLAIVDEDNRPKVWLAIDGELVEGWHPLTSVDVV